MRYLQLKICDVKSSNLENGQPHTDRFPFPGWLGYLVRRAISRTLTSLYYRAQSFFCEEKKGRVKKSIQSTVFETDTLLN